MQVTTSVGVDLKKKKPSHLILRHNEMNLFFCFFEQLVSTMVISLFRKYFCLVPYQLCVSLEKLMVTYTHFEQNKMKDKL
jgi:hypothetical protein